MDPHWFSSRLLSWGRFARILNGDGIVIASIIEKLEALEAAGVEALVDQTLSKLILSEMDRLQATQKRLRVDLARFEQSYGMSSSECAQKFEAGRLGDAADLFEWTSLYHIYQANERLMALLGEKVL
jgi:hypothetical protein